MAYNAKKNIERQNRVNSVYRIYDEINSLKSELDSVVTKVNVNLSQSERVNQINNIKSPIERKINSLKSKLKKESNSILNSNDKELINQFKDFLKEEKGLSKEINYNTKKVNNMAKGDKSKGMSKDKNIFNLKTVLNKVKNNTATKEDFEALKKYKEHYELLGEDEYGKELKEIELASKVSKLNQAKSNYDKSKSIVDDFKSKNPLEITDADKQNFSEAKKYIENLNSVAKKYKKTDKDNETDESDPFISTWNTVVHAAKGLDESNETGSEDWRTEAKSLDELLGLEDVSESDSKMPVDNIFEEIGSVNFVDNTKKEDVEKDELIDVRDDVETSDNKTTSTVSTNNLDPDNVLGDSKAEGSIDDVDLDGTGRSAEEIKSELDKKKEERALLDEAGQYTDDNYYAPDYENDNDILGTLIDSGRSIAGMIAANEEIPEYKRGQMFNLAMDDAARMRDMGLTSEEIDFRRNLAERGYGYDVKNIRRLAGGSAGVALGNLGRAARGLQDKYTEIAVTDESTRRLNRQNFQGMAMKDEAINRQIFEDDLRQTEMTKQSGASLVQDALQNMQERADYNKQYGKGSQYYDYMKEKTLGMRSARNAEQEGNANRLFKAKSDLDKEISSLESALENSDVLDVSGSNVGKKNVSNPKSSSNITIQDGKVYRGKSIFKNRTEDINSTKSTDKPIDTRSGKSKGIDSEIANLTKQMEETDDMDLAMQLDDKINKLKNKRRSTSSVL